MKNFETKGSNAISRRSFLRIGLALPLAGGAVARAFASPSSRLDFLTRTHFDFSSRELIRLGRLAADGLIEVAPVVRASTRENFQHLGWPVATRLPDGRIVVAFKKKGGHHDEASWGDQDAGRYVTWTDDLVTWQPAKLLGPEARVGAHDGMHCIGWIPMPGGHARLLLVASSAPRRLYISDDRGETWTEASSDLDVMTKNAAHCGPNFPHHPAFGPVVAFGQEKKANLNPARNRRNYLVRPLDGGAAWERRVWKNPAVARSVEPALAVWGPGHMVMITREYSDYGYGGDPERTYFHATQHVYRHEEGAPFSAVTFDTAATNIAGNGAASNDEASKTPGRPAHDTADVIFNPVSGRIEAVQSHRWGGGGARTGTTLARNKENEISSLNLWSIDPEELLAGSSTWRFDGTIIERIGYSRKGNKDGLHPGGSIVDLKRGMQHIFVYAGWRRAPCGIYRISRTLDTARWRTAAL